jgi:hypothetical protein
MNWCRVEFPEQRRVKVNRRWNGWTNVLKYLGEDATYTFTLEGEGFAPETIERAVAGTTKWSPAIVRFRRTGS